MSRTKARVNFHHGETLLHLAKNTYPTLQKSVMEMIQNALDAGARHIYVRIDLEHRHAAVLDDGEGITVEKFDQALSSIGRSTKPRKGTLGRFGLGLISPLNKAKTYTITSRPRASEAATSWVFDPERIAAQASNVDIPMRRIPELPRLQTSWNTMARWRTVVQLQHLVTDRIITMIDLDDLEMSILSNFGQAMRNHGSKCRIELRDTSGKMSERTIIPREFSGQPLEEYSVEGPEAGLVTFRLYRARSRAGQPPRGVVNVQAGDDVFLLSWKDFYRQATARKWGDLPAFRALNGGFFEGVISAKNVELHPSRTKFADGEALYDLYLQISEWFENVGRSLMDDEAEKARSVRLQELGLKSLDRWNDLLDDPEYAALRAALEGTFVFGRLGTGHVDPATGRPGDFQDKTSIRTGQGGAGKPRVPRDKPTGGTGTGEKDRERDPDRPGDLPLGVIGPRGQRRQLVKHDSIGLQIAHEPLDSTNLWELDMVNGILIFNVTHRLWERCESRTAWVLHLQDWVIYEVLHLLIYPSDQFEVLREAAERKSRCYVEQFICTTPPKRA